MVPQVFRAHTDGHLRVLNSVFPPAVARFVRLQPLSWHGRPSAQVKVLGCPVSKVTPRMRSSDCASLPPPPPLRCSLRPLGRHREVTFPLISPQTLHPYRTWMEQRPTPLPPPQRDRCWWRRGTVSTRSRLGLQTCTLRVCGLCTCRPLGPSQAVMAAVGVVLALLMCGSCLLAGVWWKRR